MKQILVSGACSFIALSVFLTLFPLVVLGILGRQLDCFCMYIFDKISPNLIKFDSWLQRWADKK